MKQSSLKLGYILLTLTFLLTPGVILGETNTTAADNTTDSIQDIQDESNTPEKKLIDPEFPKRNKLLVMVEGESAVSTNFTKQPILNYGCSEYRTIQLNRTTGLQNSAPFYMEFIFYVEEGGFYDFWYGGTPPGPEDDLFPSFSSPFRYILDDQPAQPIYREDINVVEEYAPSYYWNRVHEVELTPGQHRMRIEVTEKRRYDGKYFFYFDTFFFVRTDSDEKIAFEEGERPRIFPTDLDDRSIDNPFRDIGDYETLIRNNSEQVDPYVTMALIYSMIGDYLNAIKYLNRALILDKDNIYILQLLAKNRIWKGDVTEGLKIYNGLLEIDPDKSDIWLEAGKIAAWTGRYEDSLELFRRSLEIFPEDLNLIVNYGLTTLWSGQEQDANGYFNQALDLAKADFDKMMDLAGIYRVNGYPEKAVPVYERAIRDFPAMLEGYLKLEQLHSEMGNKDALEKARQNLENTFKPSDTLQVYLDIEHTKQGLKDALIEDFQSQLEENPDNLALRELLAQTYFWNGLEDAAIQEYHNILTNHTFRNLLNFEKENIQLSEMIDRLFVYRTYFKTVSPYLQEYILLLQEELTEYNDAEKGVLDWERKLERAKRQGTEDELERPSRDPYDRLNDETQRLGVLISDGEQYILEYETLVSDYNELLPQIATLAEEDAEAFESFENLISPLLWRWNKNEVVNELIGVARTGMPLAYFSIGKVFQIFDQVKEARDFYIEMKILDNNITSDFVEYGITQTDVWLEDTKGAPYDRASIEVAEYAPYTMDITFLAEDMVHQEIDVPALVTDGRTQVFELINKLKGLQRDSGTQIRTLSNNISTVNTIFKNRMIQSFYWLDSRTYLIKNELGDYYLASEKPTQARKYFLQVLAIDPWNISAQFKLGQVFQWEGDWKSALGYYKQVFYSDPLFDNVTRIHNQLSQANPNLVDFKAGSSFTKNQINFSTTASFTNKLSSIFAVKGAYTMESVRNYVPVSTSGGTEKPSTRQLHRLAFSTPLNLYFILDMKINPEVGIIAPNALDDDTVGSNAGEKTDWGLLNYFGYYNPDWYFKANGSLNLGPYIFIAGGYEYGPKAETIPVNRKPVYFQSIDAGVSVAFTWTQLPVLQNLSVRSYGKGEFLDDSNNLTTLSQEISFLFYPSKQPFSILSFSGNVVYQDSYDADTTASSIYYMPKEVLTAGGNLVGSVYLGLGDGNVLELGLNGSAGIFIEALSAARPETPTSVNSSKRTESVSFGGGLRVGFSDGRSYYYLALQGSGAYRYYLGDPGVTGSPFTYWFGSIELGFSNKASEILAP